jgi:hypothetical protein
VELEFWSIPPGGEFLEADWFVVAVEAVETAAAEAQDALVAVVESLIPARQARERGESVLEILRRAGENGPGSRRAAGLALQRYEQASQSMRAEIIRHFVTDEGLSLSEAARIMHISRQRAARILSSASDPLDASPPDPEHVADSTREGP